MKVSKRITAAALAAAILLTSAVGCSGGTESISQGSSATGAESSITSAADTASTSGADESAPAEITQAAESKAESSSVSGSGNSSAEASQPDNGSSAESAVTSGFDEDNSAPNEDSSAPADSGSDTSSAASTTVQQTTTSATTPKSDAKPNDEENSGNWADRITDIVSTVKPSNYNKPSVEGGEGLTEAGSGSEGTASKGKFNYGEALQKAILFYELQRSGNLDESTLRTNWRGDSGLNDGSDVGLDLTGGLYDAGDNAKFNLPMAYTSAMLAWSVYEDRDAYEKSGQLAYIMDTIRWVNDYLIKCHPEKDVYYYQVGDGNKDHAWWGAAEVMQMERPSFKVTVNSPGSAVVGEAAASLAACAVVFRDSDPDYAKECLTHAKQLYDFAERTKSDSGYTAANGFYNSWSGFYDELTWAGAWLYLATNDNTYLTKAETYAAQTSVDYKWTQCWDDVDLGGYLLLAKITGKQAYKNAVEKNLDWWTTGTGGERVTYTPKGLAWVDNWGSLRYATTSAFVAAVYADWEGCPSSKKKAYTDFYESQVNYALGSTGRSFVVGFGENPPEHPHHRTAQGSWADNMSEPNYHRHTLYGALVGGPNASDGYTDVVSDYNCNEVACDYNAGFVGVLAKMYGKYGGKTLKDFGAVEPKEEELYVEHRINAQGNGFTEIKAMIYNKSAWPARVTDNLELRYFMDLSELYEAGGSAADLQVSLNYAEGAKSGGIFCWNESKHIYYVAIDFSGVKIYPGGQSAYKKEVQFRITSPSGVWNADNDPSYAELVGTNGSELVRASHSALYEGGKLVFGTEPDGKSAGAVKPVSSTSRKNDSNTAQNTTSAANNLPQNPTAEDNGIAFSVSQQQAGGSGNTIQFALDIKNNTGKSIDLSTLKIAYFFTKDGNQELNFWCDHAAIGGSGYTALTGSVTGEFSAAKGENSDTKCTVSLGGGNVNAGDTVTVQVRITRADWSDFNLSNDYSGGNAEHIVIYKNNSPIFGEQP